MRQVRMLVAVDIGNTNIVTGFLDTPSEGKASTMQKHVPVRQIISTYRMATHISCTGDEYGIGLLQFLALSSYKPSDVEGVIISSVVPQIMHSFRAGIIKFLGCSPVIVGPGVKTGINVKMDDPKSMGADCLADCVAAYHLYSRPALVIDIGTATTYNIVDPQGSIIMGAISPGLQASAHALAGDTAQLPNVEITRPDTILAKNTSDAIRAGLYYTFLGGLGHIVSRCREEYSEDLTVIMTGGLGHVVEEDARNLGLIDIYDPDLIFKGMDIIYTRTAQGRK